MCQPASFRVYSSTSATMQHRPCAWLTATAGMALLLAATATAAFELPRVRHVGPGNDCDRHLIQDAINDANSGDTIQIEDSTYTGQHLLIQDKSLSFKAGLCTPVIGGAAPDAVAATHVVISGSGGANTSVFTIIGTSTVDFTALTISGGHSSGQGGGINFFGTGTVTLTDVSVLANTANYGGGINFNGSGDSELHIEHDTLITGNTATSSGGGIRMDGNSRLFVLAPYTFIAYNHVTNGNGGGIAISGPARADIGSPGYGSLGVIYGNEAIRGGGISVTAGTSGTGINAYLRLFSTSATEPVRISSNTAHGIGGGIYLQPYDSPAVENDRSYADMCGTNFRIDANLAQEGVAIYSDEENNFAGAVGGGVYLDSTGCGPESAASLGAVECTRGSECNMIDGNEAYKVDTGEPTAGSILLMQDNADLSINRLLMRDNIGAHMIRLIGTRDTTLKNMLMVENYARSIGANPSSLASSLIFQQQDSLGLNYPLTIDSCTIANNQVDGSYVLDNQVGLNLRNSIVDVADTATLHYTGGGGSLDVGYVLIDDADGVPLDSTIQVGLPTFFDSAHGDYRLQYSTGGSGAVQSLGLDFAPAIAGDDRDVRSSSHDQQLAVTDVFGPRDLGAIEMQPIADRIFAAGCGDAIVQAF